LYITSFWKQVKKRCKNSSSSSSTPRFVHHNLAFAPHSLPAAAGEMSFFFRAASRPRQPQQELVRSIKDSLLALDTKTGAKVLLPSLSSLPSVTISVHFLVRSVHSNSRLAPRYPN
jgi:hypothetical protein